MIASEDWLLSSEDEEIDELQEKADLKAIVMEMLKYEKTRRTQYNLD